MVVNTAADEDAGSARSWETFAAPSEAGATLTLREALWIAANHPGPDTILFDPAVFTVEAPVTIELAALRMPINLRDFCLDARGRGVVVRWSAASLGGVDHVWSVGPGSLMIGLDIATVPYRFTLNGGQLAGCRFRTSDPSAPGDSFFSVDVIAGTLGPGNVFAGPGGISCSSTPTPTEIIGNFFGVEPQTGERLPLTRGAMLWSGTSGEISFRNNTFAATTMGIEAPFPAAGTRLVIEQNRFTGMQKAIAAGTVNGRVGPDNIIRAGGSAVEVAPSSAMVITRNSISGNVVGIVGGGSAPFDLFIDGGVGGQCPAPGLVEVFTDPGAEGEQFVGEVVCKQSLAWFITASVPSGRNVTATLTRFDGGTSVFSAPVTR